MLQPMLRKEEVETINKADGLIFQTEKQLKEFGEKFLQTKKQQSKLLMQN
jgi:molecular chaperone DnaK (HSP70)